MVWTKVVATVFLLFWVGLVFAANEIIINGLYHGKNLLIQNPLSRANSSFCINEIYLNDNLIIQEPRISAVEIDLSEFQLYEPLMIKIIHRDDCLPYLLNPEALVFKREFEYQSVKADETSVIWISSGEDSTGLYYLDKAIDQLWTPIAEFRAQGEFGNVEYRFELFHDLGANMYRVRYKGEDGKTTYSNQVEYLRIQEPITFSPKNVINTITLSHEAFYEVFDQEMNQITKGEGTLINLSGLPSGTYILVLDGQQHQFFKQ